MKNFGLLLILFLSLLGMGKIQAQDREYNSLNKINVSPFSLPIKQISPSKKLGHASNSTSFIFVYVFLSPECPLCKNYIPVLNDLLQKYSNISIIGIVPGKAYSKKAVKKFSAEYNVGFSLYLDEYKKITNSLGATVTPEVIVLTRDYKKIYQGAIDDWVADLGAKRIKVSKKYLENAIMNTLKKEPVSISYTKAKGCLINNY